MEIAKETLGKSAGASGEQVTDPVVDESGRGAVVAQAARSIAHESEREAQLKAILSARLEAARAAQVAAARAVESVNALLCKLPGILRGDGTVEDEAALSTAVEDARPGIEDAARKSLLLYAQASVTEGGPGDKLEEIVTALFKTIRAVDSGVSVVGETQDSHEAEKLVAQAADLEAAQRAEAKATQKAVMEVTQKAILEAARFAEVETIRGNNREEALMSIAMAQTQEKALAIEAATESPGAGSEAAPAENLRPKENP